MEQYRMNQPAVIDECVDGEYVLINLEKGHYFSLTGTGAVLWEDLKNGMPIAEVLRRTGARFDCAGVELDTVVGTFVGELEREGLIVPVNGNGGNGSVAIDAVMAKSPEPFTAPELQKFTDMEDLLLLDPIHEVNESGWPYQSPDAQPGKQ